VSAAGRGRGRPAAGASAPPREAILEAALAAFAANGYEGTSVREVARELGVSHALVAHHVGSKEELWRAAVDHGFGGLFAELVTVLDAPPGDDLSRLRALVVRFVEANAARPALLRVIQQEAATPGPRLDHLFDTYIEPVRRFGEVVLDALAAAGKVRSRSAVLLYFLMTHGAGGPLALPALAARFGAAVDPDDPAAVHEYAVEAVDLLFEGLGRY
jgi:AcrR family transcriptional regulator